MDGFFKAASLDEVTPARPKRVTVEDHEVVLFNSLDQKFAIENLCPHQHYKIFHQSMLDGTILTCPMHGWKFDLRTGNSVAGSGKVKVYEVRIHDGAIFVKIPPPVKSIFS